MHACAITDAKLHVLDERLPMESRVKLVYLSVKKQLKASKDLSLVNIAGRGTVGQRCTADTVVHAAGKGASGQLSSQYSSVSAANGEALQLQ